MGACKSMFCYGALVPKIYFYLVTNSKRSPMVPWSAAPFTHIFHRFCQNTKRSYHFQSNLNNCLEDGTFVLNRCVTALPAQPQSIIGLPPSSTTWQRRQVRCRLITKALMREPAAAWSCRNPYCLAGLMAIPWGHTLLLPQHAGKYSSSHKSPDPPRDLFLKSEADRCEEESKTRG